MKQPGLVVALAYDGLALFEFGIATELFGLPRTDLEIPWYQFKVANVGTEPCGALGGVTLMPSDGIEVIRKAQTIVVPGWGESRVPSAELVRALRAAARRDARFLSICSGVFLLAQAGLLDGKRATTHWRYTESLQRRFPAIEVVPDVLYVDEGQIITSAGSAAGIDAGLHLIRRDFGSAVANQVARRLVVTPHRQGGQKQFVPAPVYAGSNKKFETVLQWALSRLDQPLSVRDLAAHAAMSERHFLRRFSELTGLTPRAWLQQARIGRARELIESSGMSIDRVAEQCGFSSVEAFRVAFRKEVGIAPGSYRARFSQMPG
ncbi:MAG TPA: transcriptional regulator FtrA [Paucimonas sp.]|nr:transcriptional regulator FtrA [Paucimonas sp.]